MLLQLSLPIKCPFQHDDESSESVTAASSYNPVNTNNVTLLLNIIVSSHQYIFG